MIPYQGNVIEAFPLFLYPFSMKLEINPRGNGACPLCVRTKECKIKAVLLETVGNIKGPASGSELEIVVYTCPLFKENQ
jgi:hypothetical protein